MFGLEQNFFVTIFLIYFSFIFFTKRWKYTASGGISSGRCLFFFFFYNFFKKVWCGKKGSANRVSEFLWFMIIMPQIFGKMWKITTRMQPTRTKVKAHLDYSVVSLSIWRLISNLAIIGVVGNSSWAQLKSCFNKRVLREWKGNQWPLKFKLWNWNDERLERGVAFLPDSWACCCCCLHMSKLLCSRHHPYFEIQGQPVHHGCCYTDVNGSGLAELLPRSAPNGEQ